jgi:hypothetical protein
MPPGRPPAFDSAKRKELLRLLAAGCSVPGAARILQCSPRTIRRAATHDPEFREALKRAQLRSQVAPIRALRKAAKTHWRAAAWLLERSSSGSFVPQKANLFLPEDVQDIFSGFIQSIRTLITDPQLAQRVIQALEDYLTKKTEQLQSEDFEVRRRRAAKRRQEQSRRRSPDLDTGDLEDSLAENDLTSAA